MQLLYLLGKKDYVDLYFNDEVALKKSIKRFKQNKDRKKNLKNDMFPNYFNMGVLKYNNFKDIPI